MYRVFDPCLFIWSIPFSWYVLACYCMHWDAGTSFLSLLEEPRASVTTLQHWFPIRHCFTLFLLQCPICCIWYDLAQFAWLFSVSFGIPDTWFIFLLVKAGLHGVHTRCKCSHVHYTQTDYSGLHNGCGVFSNRTEIFTPCCRQVRNL